MVRLSKKFGLETRERTMSSSSSVPSSSTDQVLLQADNCDEFIRRMMSSLMLTAKESNGLPEGDDFNYYSMFPEFADATSSIAQESTELIRRISDMVLRESSSKQPTAKKQKASSLAGSAGISGGTCSSLIVPDELADESELFEQVIDVVDLLLQGADEFLQQGAKGGGVDASASKSLGPNGKRKSGLAAAAQQSLSLDRERVLQQSAVSVTEKPQLRFWSMIDNRRETSFEPRCLKQLAAVGRRLVPVRTAQSNNDSGSSSSSSGSNTMRISASAVVPEVHFPHPFEQQLRALPYPHWCRPDSRKELAAASYTSAGDSAGSADAASASLRPPAAPGPEDAAVLVETVEAFEALLADLNRCRSDGSREVSEIALDLEHNALRSFQGITCLMQVRKKGGLGASK